MLHSTRTYLWGLCGLAAYCFAVGAPIGAPGALFPPSCSMETPAFVATIFVWCLLLSITGYSLYIGFGPPSKELRDPFDEHED